MIDDLFGIFGVERVETFVEPRAHVFDVATAVVGSAHRIDEKCDLLEANRYVKVVEHGDDFDVEIGVLGTDGFSAELVVLTETPCLRTLVAE